MFTKISANNFRVFKEIKLESLKRVNIFTGMNGCGKTSILEIPFLIAGANNARLSLSLYNFRNESRISPNSDKPFRSLFHNLDISNKIELESEGDFKTTKKAGKRKLLISPIKTNINIAADTNLDYKISGLLFDFIGPNGKKVGSIKWETIAETERGELKPNIKSQLKTNTPPCLDQIQAYFVSPYYRDLWDQAHSLLTEITKNNKVDDLVNDLKIIEPRLKNLLPLSEDGIPSIYADVGSPNKLIPVFLLGAGFSNILHIILDATILRNGLLIIDEIEDGVHFSVIPMLINYLFLVATNHNLQIFLSTHSDEIINIIAQISKKMNFTDFSFYKLVHKENEIIANQFTSDEVLISREVKSELR